MIYLDAFIHSNYVTFIENSLPKSWWYIAISLLLQSKKEVIASTMELFLTSFKVFLFAKKLNKDVPTLLHFRSIVPIVNNCIEKVLTINKHSLQPNHIPSKRV